MLGVLEASVDIAINWRGRGNENEANRGRKDVEYIVASDRSPLAPY